MARVVIYMSDGDKAKLRERAAAHGVSMSRYASRAVLNTVCTPEDEWWDAMTPRQRVGIFEWLRRRPKVVDVTDQPLPLELGPLPKEVSGKV